MLHCPRGRVFPAAAEPFGCELAVLERRPRREPPFVPAAAGHMGPAAVPVNDRTSRYLQPLWHASEQFDAHDAAPFALHT